MITLSEVEKSYLTKCIDKFGSDKISGFYWRDLAPKLRQMNEKFKNIKNRRSYK